MELYLLFHVFDNNESQNDTELIATHSNRNELYEAVLKSARDAGVAVDLRIADKGARNRVEDLWRYPGSREVLVIEEWQADDLSVLPEELARRLGWKKEPRG